MKKKKKASADTFGATCCRTPKFTRVSRFTHPHGDVYECRSKTHSSRYFVVPRAQNSGTTLGPVPHVQLFRTDRPRKEGKKKGAAPPPPPPRTPANKPGRAKGVPRGHRALTPWEKEAVHRVLADPAARKTERGYGWWQE